MSNVSPPLCPCHEMPKKWIIDRSKKAGGYWMCHVKRLESQQRYDASKKRAEAKRRYEASKKGRQARRKYESNRVRRPPPDPSHVCNRRFAVCPECGKGHANGWDVYLDPYEALLAAIVGYAKDNLSTDDFCDVWLPKVAVRRGYLDEDEAAAIANVARRRAA